MFILIVCQKGNQPMTDNIIVVDCNYIVNVAKHAMKGISLKHDNIHTSIIFKFMQELNSLIKQFKSRKFAFCWDSEKSKRLDMYPEYKANRKDKSKLTEDDLIYNRICFNQFELIRTDVLPSIGFKNVFFQEGYEGDDIIAAIAKNSNGNKIIIVANDHDLYQLLAKDVSLFNIHTNKKYTEKDFYNDHGILPEQWGEVQTIAGCTTDHVKGIYGVGDKTAILYITGKLSRSRSTYVRILSESGQRIIERNRKIVLLPFEGTITPQLNFNETFKLRAFEDVCEKYGLYSFLKTDKLIEWRNLLEMV